MPPDVHWEYLAPITTVHLLASTVQHKWWEFDITYYSILMLERLGLATHFIRARHLRQAGR